MSLGHHQNMTGEMRTLRVQCSLGPMPRLQLSLLRVLAAMAWQSALAAATRALPPSRDASLLSARPPHLAAAPVISVARAGVHLRSSLSQFPSSGAAHMKGSGPQRPSRDESTSYPFHHQQVSRRAERNASFDRHDIAVEPDFVAAVKGANFSAIQGRERNKSQSGSINWPPQQHAPQPTVPPAPPAAPVAETVSNDRTWLGLPKFIWAVFLNIIAMLIFIACIPFILTIAKRRRMQPSQS